MKLRRALLADAPFLAVVEATRPQAAGWKEEGFAAELQQPCARIWCSIEEEKITGFLALRVTDGFCEILNVAVLPQRANRGIGKALVAQALAELKQEGPCRVTLEVAKDNLPARALYAQAGFQPLGRRKDFYGAGRDALILGMDV